jgi:hypothetical protein
MKKQNAYISTLAIVCSSMISLSAFGASFPKTPEGMNTKTAEEMKAWPDIKVKLGKPLTEAAFKNKTETELSLMRNSIVAQAGFQFTNPWLKSYFASRNWYKAGKFDPKVLSPVDYANAAMIKKYQREHGLLTVSNTPIARNVAGVDTPSKLTGDILHSRILTMRYCDFYIGSDYAYTLTFHRDGTVNTSEMGDNGAYGTSYGEAYGDAYGSSYGGAYGGNAGITSGKWNLTTDKVHISVAMQGLTPTTLYFGTRSYYAHRCYSDPSGIP